MKNTSEMMVVGICKRKCFAWCKMKTVFFAVPVKLFHIGVSRQSAPYAVSTLWNWSVGTRKITVENIYQSQSLTLQLKTERSKVLVITGRIKKLVNNLLIKRRNGSAERELYTFGFREKFAG